MDDEVLGLGGTIRRHVLSGDFVSVVIVANRVYDHLYDTTLIEREKLSCRKAKDVLGYHQLIFLDCPDEKLDHTVIDVIVPLEQAVASVNPDAVYIPHRGDNNQDHRAVFDAARVVFRPFTQYAPKIIRAYEVPSSTDISPYVCEWPFLPTFFVDIDDFLEKKLEAVACYEAELRVFPHPRSPEAIKVYAMKRGVEIGVKAAEAFVVVRGIWF